MSLKEIYQPIEKELTQVESILKEALVSTNNEFILKVCSHLLEGKGKRLRPALVLLSAKATQESARADSKLINIATAMELIHMASLVHDDIIDKANVRYDMPTVNSKWGQDISIALGDYLYSVAFELIADCGNSDIVRSISSATKAMCEGEFIQVCERDNLDIQKEKYIVIVKKKTASLFVASCQAGTLISNSNPAVLRALEGYGLNFGVAFQIIDDYLDLVGDEKMLGKVAGQDLEAGETTLPVLNLLESVPISEREQLRSLLVSRGDKEALSIIKKKIFTSKASLKTKETTLSFVNLAKDKINILSYSPYKESLLNLADFIMERGFDNEPKYDES